MSEFPAEDVLIARGKYSTLASEKRAFMKAMRGDLETVSTCAGRVLRAPDDVVFMREQATQLSNIAARVMQSLAQVEHLQGELDGLKPLAWGGKAEHEQ